MGLSQCLFSPIYFTSINVSCLVSIYNICKQHYVRDKYLCTTDVPNKITGLPCFTSQITNCFVVHSSIDTIAVNRKLNITQNDNINIAVQWQDYVSASEWYMWLSRRYDGTESEGGIIILESWYISPVRKYCATWHCWECVMVWQGQWNYICSLYNKGSNE